MKLMPMKQFTALCTEIGTSTVTLRGKVQMAAVIAIGYTLVHGDVGATNRLFDSVKDAKTIRRDSLVAFIEKFSPATFMTSEKKFVMDRERRDTKFKDVVYDAEYVKLMDTNPWFDAKKESPLVSSLEVDTELDKWLRRMKKLAATPGCQVQDLALLGEIEAIQGRYNATKTLGISQATLARLQPEIEADNAAIRKARAEAAAKLAAEQANAVTLPPLQQVA